MLSEGDGRFRFTALQEGKYTLTASLEGFATARAAVVVVAADVTTERSLDLPLATLTQTVEVMAPASIVSAADTLGAAESIGSRETDEFANGSGLGGALRLLASVIEVPGGVSIKGGRPTQAGVQIGASTLTDPVLGLVHFTLPDDAIDSVAVMPNPYAVEYGRFSSGLVVIQTRRGGDAWRVRLNNLSPTFRSKRHEDLYNINGIASFGPNFAVGGPIVKNRLFLEQTAQYRYSSDDVPSRPEDERRTTHWIELVHPRRRQPDAEAFARRHRRLLPEHHHARPRSAPSRRPTRPSTSANASSSAPPPSARCGATRWCPSRPCRCAAITRRCSRRAPRRCSCCRRRRSATSSTPSTARRPRSS